MTREFPHEWLVTRKMFAFDDVIMTSDTYIFYNSQIIRSVPMLPLQRNGAMGLRGCNDLIWAVSEVPLRLIYNHS